MLDHGTIILRLCIAAALGAVIGYERDRHKRSAGLRTHLLVSLASALFLVVSTQFAYYHRFSQGGIVEVDVSRIASNVVSGAGFLAGGAIFRSGLTVQGMTTAAGLWLVAAIGMAAGSGMYPESFLATLLGLVALWLLGLWERRWGLKARGRVALQMSGEPSLAELRALIERAGAVVTRYRFRRQVAPEPSVAADFAIRHAEGFEADRLLAELSAQPGVLRVSVERRS